MIVGFKLFENLDSVVYLERRVSVEYINRYRDVLERWVHLARKNGVTLPYRIIGSAV
jgi:hypothetical protein